jgi:hypothetical protein
MNSVDDTDLYHFPFPPTVVEQRRRAFRSPLKCHGQHPPQNLGCPHPNIKRKCIIMGRGLIYCMGDTSFLK